MTSRLPVSTYRLQIRPEFTLFDAAEICGYLAELGVDALYLSPLLTAATGSDHGYDCVDPTAIDPARGGEAGWRALVAAAHEHDLKIIVDIVPNHQGIAVPRENPAWWDVLRNGQQSRFADWFDIDWSRGPIVVPILGSADDIAKVTVDGDVARYFDHELPLAPGSASPGEAVADVLQRQHWRLVDWRAGNTDLDYRRFFAITTLAGVRVEDERVYTDTHERILRWVDEQQIDGLRVDHPDGLVDPGAYMARLREALGERWLLGEKILAVGEPLPDWPFDGTVGYDAMFTLGHVFVDPAGEEFFDTYYRELTGDDKSAAEHELAGKRHVAGELFAAEGRRIAALAPEVDQDLLSRAVREVAAHFEVYRTYLPDGVEHLDAALAATTQDSPEFADVLAQVSPRLHDPADELARRMQQLTGAVLAKGVEDTAFYRYSRLTALNEVGGDPGVWGIGLDDFHAELARRNREAPRAMTALSTHDTKRSEDVRARITALTEAGDDWAHFAGAFLAQAAIPDVPFAYLLAQTLVGAGPIERERMHAYATKAMREASVSTTWTDPDEGFEAAVHRAVDLAYDDDSLRETWDRLARRIQPGALANSLGQKLVQLTMPGIPDVYQGTEIWDDSLVDPDNRRPVDFAALSDQLPTAMPVVDGSGAAKQWIVGRALRVRRDKPRQFRGYERVPVTGPAADHAIAFDRGGAITVATRFSLRLQASGGWKDTTLDVADGWVDQLTGRRWSGPIRLAELLTHFPVALLTR